MTAPTPQPGAEPEPEYEPRTVYVDAVGTRFWSVNGENGVLFVDEYGDAEDPAYVTEPRPLVVLTEEESREWRQWKDS